METENKDHSEKNHKSWTEKLLDNLAGNAEIVKNLIALLTSPLVASSLTIAFICWIFKSRESRESSGTHIQVIREELARIKRKYKKLKKKHKKARQGFYRPLYRPNTTRGESNADNYGSGFLN